MKCMNIVVDVEATYNKNNKRDFREIISIGAYKLDDDYQIIGSFETYVRPLYHKNVSKHITRLTGITKSDTEKGDTYYQIINDLKEWAGDNAVFYAWGNSDRRMIEINAKKYQIDVSWFSDSYIDVQYIYNKERESSLDKAIAALGHSFTGNRHTAIDDALNTVKVMQHLDKKRLN